MFRLIVSSRSSRVSPFGVVVATMHCASSAESTRSRRALLSSLIFSLYFLYIFLSLSHTHSHTLTRRTHMPHTTRQPRGAQRVAPWRVPTHANAFVQSFCFKKTLCFYLFQKKKPRPLLLFFFPKIQGLGRPRSLDCGRVRTPLRFRIGAHPRRCLWRVVPPRRSAALVVVVNLL